MNAPFRFGREAVLPILLAPVLALAGCADAPPPRGAAVTLPAVRADAAPQAAPRSVQPVVAPEAGPAPADTSACDPGEACAPCSACDAVGPSTRGIGGGRPPGIHAPEIGPHGRGGGPDE